MFDLTIADEELESSSPLIGLFLKENPLDLFLESDVTTRTGYFREG